MEPIRATDLLADAWRVVRERPLLAAPLVVLSAIGGAGRGEPQYTYDAQRPLELLPFYALLGLIGLLVALALFALHSLAVVLTARAALDRAPGREPEWGRAWTTIRPRWGEIVVASFLWLGAVVLGLIALVVPGFIVLAGLLPLPAVLASETARGTQALSRTWGLTRGHKGSLLAVGLLLLLASILISIVVGWIPLVGGVLAGAGSGLAIVVGVVAGCLFYERATSAGEGESRVTARGGHPWGGV